MNEEESQMLRLQAALELLEPHFFDFSGDLYGQEIAVAFHHFLRP